MKFIFTAFTIKSKLIFFTLVLIALQSCGGGSGDSGGASPDSSTNNVPEPFTFLDLTNVSINTEKTSNIIKITGMNSEAPINIIGGMYSINGGAFTKENGFISSNQEVQVKQTSLSTFSSRSDTTLTIGGVNDVFSVTTVSQGVDTSPLPFNFTEKFNATLNTEYISNKITINGINSDTNVSISAGASYAITALNGIESAFTTTAGTVILGEQIRIKLTSSNLNSILTKATLVVGTESAIFKVTTFTPNDSTPAAFPFTAQNNVALNVVVTSNPVTVQGINVPASISITGAGGFYSINSGQFISTASTVNNGDIIQVRLTASNTASTPKTATVTIGTVSEVFSVTTVGQDITPVAFPFNAQTNIALGAVTISNAIVVSGVNVPTTISISGVDGAYSINSGNFISSASTVNNGDLVQVRLIASNSVSTPKSTILTIGTISSTFTVTTIPQDILPTAFPFTEKFGALLNSIVISNTITVSGINVPATISISAGGKYSINGGAFRRVSGDTVISGDTVRVQLTSANTISTPSQITLTIGSGSSIFKATTVANVAGVIVTPLSLGNMNEGTTKTFSVKLNSEPLNNITLSITSSLPNQASVNKNSLTFTRTVGVNNWSKAQTVTVSAINDGIVDPDTQVSINLNIISGDSSGYNVSLNKLVSATIINTNFQAVKDPNGFLQFLNKTAPRNNELSGKRLADQLAKTVGQTELPNGVVLPVQQIADAGLAYYAAIDPQNKRTTLTAFKAFNNNLSDTPNAVYVNDADLGFGRRMYLTSSTDGTVASCVENFAPLIQDPKFPNDATKKVPNPNASPDIKLNLARVGDPTKIVATVCMEYSGTPGSGGTTAGTLTGRKFVKFFSYIGNGSRITEADLDGRGLKTQPGLCNTCHGGQAQSLRTDGTYPFNGDTGAQFLPWDLNTFIYAHDPQLSTTANAALDATARSNLEPLLKKFNEGVLTTYPQPKTFKFTGNIVIPAAPVPSTLTNYGTPSVGTSTITVSNASPLIITNFVLSIDDDGQGGPGLSYNTDYGVQLKLTSPTGIIFYPSQGFTTPLGPVRIISSGIKNLYFSDDGEGRYLDIPEGPNVINGNITGTVFGVSHGFINNTECINNLPQSPSPTFSQEDIGCTNANGDWILEVTNQSANPVNIKAWSVHFNGVPDGAYIPAPVELIRGWYGGKTLPLANFNSNFVPNGWLAQNNTGAAANTETLYLKVVGPTCRACHAQRGTMASNEIDFSSYKKFMNYADRTRSLVYEKGLMPMAKRTFEGHFWNSNKPDILAQHMTGNVTNVRPGRNIAKAGIARIGTLGVTQGSVVTLNGGASLFPNDFTWIVLGPDNLPVTLTVKKAVFDAQGVKILDPRNTSFTASLPGIYQVKLDTSGNLLATPEMKATTSILSSAAIVPVNFKNSIIFEPRWNNADGAYRDANGNILDGTTFESSMSTCESSRCHGGINYDAVRRVGRINYVNVKEDPITFETFQPLAGQQENYRLLRDRIDIFSPMDSLTIRKGLNQIRHGGKGRYGDRVDNRANWTPTGSGVGRESYDNLMRWILEGANFN